MWYNYSLENLIAKVSGTTPALLSEYSDICNAIKIDAKSVKSIESILSKKLYLVVANTTTSTLFNNHENIRGSDYYK